MNLPTNPIVGAIAGVAAGVAGVAVVGLLITTASNSEENADAVQLIKDCTIEPAGKCAELQRQQGRMFVRMIALGNACADRPGHQTPAQIERCIRKGIKE